MNKLFCKIILNILFTLLFLGCNIFDWTYSAEKSTDFDIILSEAEGYFKNKDYKKALALYDKAVEVQSNSSIALYGRIQCRLFKQTGGKSTLTYFSNFFSPLSGNTNDLFSKNHLELADFYNDMQKSINDISLINKPFPLSDEKINTNSSSFLSDSAISYCLLSYLTILDSNTNNMPSDPQDKISITKDFVLHSSTNLNPSNMTNIIIALTLATNRLTLTTNLIYKLSLISSNYLKTDSMWYNLKINILHTITNSHTIITNTESLL